MPTPSEMRAAAALFRAQAARCERDAARLEEEARKAEHPFRDVEEAFNREFGPEGLRLSFPSEGTVVGGEGTTATEEAQDLLNAWREGGGPVESILPFLVTTILSYRGQLRMADATIERLRGERNATIDASGHARLVALADELDEDNRATDAKELRALLTHSITEVHIPTCEEMTRTLSVYIGADAKVTKIEREGDRLLVTVERPDT
jgi:hypothetical protein